MEFKDFKGCLKEFIEETEAKHFRTEHDTGANSNALFIWNLLRDFVGLNKLRQEDLPRFCKTHNRYHILKGEYGCVYGKTKE